MGKETLTFGNIEIEKNNFYHHKTPIFWGDVDTEKVLVLSTLLVTCKKIIKLSHYI